jgi:hypothetical protein
MSECTCRYEEGLLALGSCCPSWRSAGFQQHIVAAVQRLEAERRAENDRYRKAASAPAPSDEEVHTAYFEYLKGPGVATPMSHVDTWCEAVAWRERYAFPSPEPVAAPTDEEIEAASWRETRYNTADEAAAFRRGISWLRDLLTPKPEPVDEFEAWWSSADGVWFQNNNTVSKAQARVVWAASRKAQP